MRIVTLTKEDRIVDMVISGTIHASPLRPTSPIHEIEKVLKGQPLDQRLFELKIAEVLTRPDFSFAKVTPELLACKIYECVTQ